MTTRTVRDQFGPAAADYASFSYHAAGPDLAPMLAAGEMDGGERVLDLGCGAGHATLLFAPHAREVVALDPTPQMLEQARRLAVERGVTNVSFELGRAEQIRSPDDSFDRVISRQSAHHWRDLRAALAGIDRVLSPGGRFVLIDTVASDDAVQDRFLNSIELLRDPTHVRDYTVSEWQAMASETDLRMELLQSWSVPLDFDDWVKRSRTPRRQVELLRELFRVAPPHVREYFGLTADCGWEVPVALLVARRP
jgi:SAM-dependent methyltransferase